MGPLGQRFENTLLAYSEGTEREVLGRNLAYDDRVSVERADAFARDARGAIDADFYNRLHQYHKRRIRTPAIPEFLNPDLNANNMLARQRSWTLGPNLKLVRIQELCGLFAILDAAGVVDPVPGTRPDASRVAAWLSRKFDKHMDGDRVEPDAAREVVEPILDALADHVRRPNYFHPSWCAPAAHLRPHQKLLSTHPGLWLDFFGLWNHEPQWFIVLEYEVREAGALCRPTQLDAGNYDLHYPSPGAVISRFGGHPSNQSADHDVDLMSEFVHAQIPHTLAQWKAAGAWLVRYRPTVRLPLRLCRERHCVKLKKRYGPDLIARWMPTP